MLKCTLFGSSGLVGAACLKELSARKEISEIVCPVRNPENTEKYLKVYKEYKRIHDALAPIYRDR